MQLPVYRLRRLLVATAVLLTVVVAGLYFYARSRATNVLKTIPGKIGYDIKQTATGFQFSHSDGKRTLFTIQARDLKEFKLNGHAELHNVSIVLYGRDSSRFDQIYGDDFDYDQKSGDVTAKGDVQIDLVANPAGLASPDQSTPKELKNPIHLKTRDLVFNKGTGDAWTPARVEFRTPQASGWAVGARYGGKSNTLTLASQIHLVLTGSNSALIDAQHGVITNNPREIVLDDARLTGDRGSLRADYATFYLGSDNHVERVSATGNVTTEMPTGNEEKGPNGSEVPAKLQGRADQAEFLLAGNDLLRTATLSGNVHFEQAGAQPMQGDAGRMILDFAGRNQLQKVHAVDGAHLTQKAGTSTKPGDKRAGAEDFDLTAPVIDFNVDERHKLERAITSGAAQIVISESEQAGKSTPPQRTVVTAGRFDAAFNTADGKNHITSVHGEPDARIVNSNPGQPDRVSTSDSVTAAFFPQGGIESVTQQGHVAYFDGESPDKQTRAWATRARYTPADQMLVLIGSPRVANAGMETTADTIRVNRATADAFAVGNVKSTYSELKEQPDGALLASSSPIHVTAHSMTVHNSPSAALYSGNARLWQDANIVEAPSLVFDRDRRSVTAQGTGAQTVQTILTQPEKSAGSSASTSNAGTSTPARSPISITAMRLTYTDLERKIHYEGGVNVNGAGFSAFATNADAYLLPRSQIAKRQSVAPPGQLDHMVATGGVTIQQQARRAEGQKLVYTAAGDQFVLTGGPPCIFDAERGKITGVSLTFYRGDDRVLVEGETSTPVVTTTRVAR